MRPFACSLVCIVLSGVPVAASAQTRSEQPARTAPPAPGQRPVPESQRVRVTEGTELLARLSPDGERIAFIVVGEVFVVPRRGGDATRLTRAAEEATVYQGLAWSPDSRRLVVLHGPRGLNVAADLIDVASGRERRLATRLHNDAAWTPDGREVLLSTRDRDSTVLVAYPADGVGPTRRVQAARGNLGYVAYSPDGRHLTFGTPTRELDLETGQLRALVDSVPASTYATYSPDGRWVAFLAERSGSRQLWLAPRDGGAPRPLTRDVEDIYDKPLSWTPDGRQVLYTAAGQLRLAALDGRPDEVVPFAAEFTVARWTGLRRPEMPLPGATRRALGLVHPQLSPDGRTVVFGAIGDLWLADVAGGPPRRLTETAWADETFPRWSPDGRRLVFAEDVLGRNRRLRIVPLDTTPAGEAASQEGLQGADLTVSSAPDAPDVLPAPPLLGQALAWSPDGRRLAYFAGDDVGWLDPATGERRVVAQATRSYDHLIGWSADGAGILYTTARAAIDSAGGIRATHTVRRASASDSGRVAVWTVPPAYAVRSAWTPDLSRVAYDSGGVGYHARYDADRGTGGPATRIPDPAPRHFSWSADGAKLLYLTGSTLRLLDVATGEARTLDVAPTYQVPPAPAPLLLRGVRVIDGRGSAPSAPMDVLIADGRIARVTPAGSATAPTGARVVDGAGRMLLPGLFDAHTHQTDGRPVSPGYAYHGVLAIRDVGTGVEWMQAQRERAEAGAVLAPRIFLSGGMLVTDLGQGYEPTLRDHREVEVTDSAVVAAHVASLAAVGSDVLKFNIRDARLETTTSHAAHALGLPLTSHYLFASTFAAGLEGKEHIGLYAGTTVDWRQDLVAMTRAAGTCVTPTLLVDAMLGAGGRSAEFPLDSTYFEEPATQAFTAPEALDWPRSIFRTAPPPARVAAGTRRILGGLRSVRRLHAAGVPVMGGTDAAIPGLDLHLELELLVRAGLTPLEAIRAVTATPARCLGVDHALGTIEVGKLADLILVDGDPSRNIRDLRRIALVVMGGQPYTREEILAHARAGAASAATAGR